MGDLSLLPHLSIYSVMFYVSVDSCLLILYFELTVQSHFTILLVRLFQPWPLGARSGGP